MPWHGKSLPPVGFETEDYKLTTAGYTQMVLDICDALKLDKPVVMGCSIGGRLVLNLAAEHAHRFRALIGLESADYQQPWYDTEWLHRPDVHGGEVCAALVSGMMAPQSPTASRHETLWMYKSGGPGVFKGDLHFYRVDGDLRVERISGNLCRLDVRDDELRLVVEHLLEMRDAPVAVDGIAMETAAEMVAHTATRHGPQRQQHHIARLLVPGPRMFAQ